VKAASIVQPSSPATTPSSGAGSSKLAAIAPPNASSSPATASGASSASLGPGTASHLAALSPPASAAEAKDYTQNKSRAPTPGEISLRSASSESVRDPYNWSVMVYKSRHRLVVYFKGHLYREYEAVFGRNLDYGTKVWAGDRRTPEGVYRIISKWPNRRWRYFLKLNYPNNYDRAQYAQLVSSGEVPRWRGRALSEGDGIGIHGTDEPLLNTGKVNWTTGCISVDNGAIDELDALLPVGTLVVINP
jgi:L,D-transpeptidase catalytic domain